MGQAGAVQRPGRAFLGEKLRGLEALGAGVLVVSAGARSVLRHHATAGATDLLDEWPIRSGSRCSYCTI
jgi:hypothetical protein